QVRPPSSHNKYQTVATVDTFAGAKTIAVDPVTHNAYLFQPERGPAPPPPADAPPPEPGRGGRGRGEDGLLRAGAGTGRTGSRSARSHPRGVVYRDQVVRMAAERTVSVQSRQQVRVHTKG